MTDDPTESELGLVLVLAAMAAALVTALCGLTETPVTLFCAGLFALLVVRGPHG